MPALSFQSFSDLDGFAAKARAYKAIRAQHPLIPAAAVAQFLDDPGEARNIEQYTCAHVWNMSMGEADECGGNIRCVNCDLDGDA